MKKLPQITDESWKQVDEFNQFIWNDFLTNSTELSPKTRMDYYSNLRIWFIWVKDNLGNKKQIDIKPLEFKRFQNWMINRGCSSSDIANKRAAISSLNNYIEVYYIDAYPMFRNFINKSIGRPPKHYINEKEPLTRAEYENLVAVLTQREEWQKLAYLEFSFATGCRREESRQLLKEVVNYSPTIKEKSVDNEDGVKEIKQVLFYQTHNIRCKGKSSVGKVRKLLFDQRAMDALKKWLEVRGEDNCPHMFVAKYRGEVKQVGETIFNNWCAKDFAEIIGRRFTPHNIRRSRATQLLLEDGKDIKAAQKLLGHEQSSTTEIYVIRDDTDDVDEIFI